MKKHLVAAAVALLSTQAMAAAAPKVPALPTSGVYALFVGKYFADCIGVSTGYDGSGYPYITADGATGYVQTAYDFDSEGNQYLAGYKAAAIITGGEYGYDITFNKTSVNVLRLLNLYSDATVGDAYTFKKYKLTLKLDSQGKYCAAAKAARTSGGSAEAGGKIAARFKKPD